MTARRPPDRAAHWSRYLKDLEAYASLPQPLEAVGTLARVTGLVLEAAGVRVPVGRCATCAPKARTR
jgi:flagellum-specific ATP synthase